MNAVVVYRITKGLPTTCLWLRNPVFWEMMLLNCLWYNTCDGVLEWLIWIPMFDLSIDLKHVLFLVSTPVDTLFGNPLYSLGTLEISVLVWVHIFICRWDLSYFRAQHSHSIFLFFFASKVIAVEQAVWHSDLKCSGNTILSTLVPHLHSYNVISKPIMCWNQIRNPLV